MGATASLTLAVLLFLFFVYPTPWVIATNNGEISRANRLTGVREYATGSGWKRDVEADFPDRARDLQVVSFSNFVVRVRNNSNKPFDGDHNVRFTMLDNQGVNLGTDSEMVHDLQPGETAELTLQLNSPTLDAYQRIANARVDRAN